MSDPISNMLTSIRNAQAVSHEIVNIPFSVLKYQIAMVLQKRGFIGQIEKKGRKPDKLIKITLKYKNKTPVISGIKRVSRSGQRIYISSQSIRKIKNGYGISVISTPKGLMTNEEAKNNNLGGEVICEVW
jgi:small subunit ribosomal protein S8